MQADEQAELEATLLDREGQRREALVTDNMDALAGLLTDDLIHVHATGNVQGKQELLGHAGGFLQFIDVERGPLTIRRLAKNVAVMTGSMTNTVRRRGHDEQVVVGAFVTQVWVRREAGWQIASFHSVRWPQEAPAQ